MSEMSALTYKQSRTRFLQATIEANFQFHSQKIKGTGIQGEALTQDFAYFSNNSETTIVHMSGVHGIEGYVGSNIQCEFLKSFSRQHAPHANCIIVHAVNPYGMSWYRRTNGNNVDLNRNGVFPVKPIPNQVFAQFTDLMRCESRGQILRTLPKALLRAVGLGFQKVSTQLPAGQYEFPEMLFFGGEGRQQELQALTDQLQKLAPQTKRWVFIDVHSGLGNYAQDLLLVADGSHASLEFWQRGFAKQELTIIPEQKKIYRGQGLIEDWITSELGKSAAPVFYLMQEFGTLPGLKVLSNMILENAWFRKNLYPEQRRDLMLALFCPDQDWLNTCTQRGIQVLRTALNCSS